MASRYQGGFLQSSGPELEWLKEKLKQEPGTRVLMWSLHVALKTWWLCSERECHSMSISGASVPRDQGRGCKGSSKSSREQNPVRVSSELTGGVSSLWWQQSTENIKVTESQAGCQGNKGHTNNSLRTTQSSFISVISLIHSYNCAIILIIQIHE